MGHQNGNHFSLLGQFSTSLIFVCGYQWMYIVDPAYYWSSALHFSTDVFASVLTSNVSRLKFAKKIAKGIYTYKSILQYIYIYKILHWKTSSSSISKRRTKVFWWNRIPETECNSQTKLHQPNIWSLKWNIDKQDFSQHESWNCFFNSMTNYT